MRPPIPMSFFWMCVFIAMLFYGIVMLLPPRTKAKKKAKKKNSKKIEAIIAIVLGTSGLVLLILAFAIHNETAKTIYSNFVKVSMVIGLLVIAVKFVKRKKQNKN